MEIHFCIFFCNFAFPFIFARKFPRNIRSKHWLFYTVKPEYCSCPAPIHNYLVCNRQPPTPPPPYTETPTLSSYYLILFFDIWVWVFLGFFIDQTTQHKDEKKDENLSPFLSLQTVCKSNRVQRRLPMPPFRHDHMPACMQHVENMMNRWRIQRRQDGTHLSGRQRKRERVGKASHPHEDRTKRKIKLIHADLEEERAGWEWRGWGYVHIFNQVYRANYSSCMHML